MKTATNRRPSMWGFGQLTPVNVIASLWNQITEDEVGTRAAALAYYFVLALFPAMLVVLTIIALVAGRDSSAQASLYSSIGRMVPGSATQLVQKTLQEITNNAGAGKALIGVVGALWSAAAGISAIMDSLNVAYEVRETRPLWKQKLIALGLTFGLSTLVLLALALTLVGGTVANYVGLHFGLGSAAVLAWKIAQYPIAIGVMFLAFSATYYFAPNLKNPEWHWITPGSALGLIFWLVASFGFKIYLGYFNSYSKTYGSLGAMMILLLWLFISGYAIMVGGELNCIIGRAIDSRMRHEERVRRINDDLDRDLKNAA